MDDRALRFAEVGSSVGIGDPRGVGVERGSPAFGAAGVKQPSHGLGVKQQFVDLVVAGSAPHYTKGPNKGTRDNLQPWDVSTPAPGRLHPRRRREGLPATWRPRTRPRTLISATAMRLRCTAALDCGVSGACLLSLGESLDPASPLVTQLNIKR